MNNSYCKGCGRPIVWIASLAGRMIPCDAEPVPYWPKEKAKGKIVTPRGVVLSCELEGDPEQSAGLGYIPHFSTCPKADTFRRRAKKNG